MDPGFVLDSRWKILSPLGTGNFSVVYSGQDLLENGHSVAIKVPKDGNFCKIQLLVTEAVALREAAHAKCSQIVSLLANGYDENRDCLPFLVLERLDLTLDDLKKILKIVPENVVGWIGSECLNCMQQVHELGYVYRAAKPENFAFSRCASSSDGLQIRLKIFDLARVRRFRDIDCEEVLPPREYSRFRGALAFASVNGHERKELHRGDDLISIFFILLQLGTPGLPWMAESHSQSGNIRYIGYLKAASSVKVMTKDLTFQEQWCQFYQTILKLTYYDTPDYMELHQILDPIWYGEKSEIVKQILPLLE